MARMMRESDNIEDVLCTASLLEITEFQVFAQAYEAWYNDTPSERHLERYFGPYMFEEKTPVWVQQFTRRVLTERADEVRAICEAQVGCPERLAFALQLFIPPPSLTQLGALRHAAFLA